MAKKKKKLKEGIPDQSLPSLFDRPKKSYTIPKPIQLKGKTDHGLRPQLVFYFNSDKDLKVVIRAFGGKKREPRTSLLIKMARRHLKKRSMTGGKKK